MSTAPSDLPDAMDAADPSVRERIRSFFPALGAPTVYLDNAGGSQVPRVVADAMRDYMLSTYVQLGADYEVSKRSTRTVSDAHAFVKRLVGGEGAGEVALGSSSTALCHLLADAYARAGAGQRNEIVVAESGHEANVGAWTRLEQRGWRIRWWRIDPDSHETRIEDLESLLSDRTRLVAFPHVSNLLGGIEDVCEITRRAHAAGARVVVDGVAYAPHRAMDVGAWGVDWYVYSTYKVYGPHMAALYGTHEAFAEVEGPNHFFIPPKEIPYKFELGGASHEGCAGLLALRDYLRALVGDAGAEASSEPIDRAAIERAFERMTALELPLQRRLISYLREKAGVRIIGPATDDASRVATVSFVREGSSSRRIAEAGNAEGLGFRYGHFYAYRLCEALGLEPEDGVVRVSLVHYNTLAEVDRLIEFFERTL